MTDIEKQIQLGKNLSKITPLGILSKKGDKIVMLKSDLVELCKDIFADGGEDYEKSFESSDSYKWLKDLNVVKK